jgi:hypothetical protein
MVPLSNRVRKILETHFALAKGFPIGKEARWDLKRLPTGPASEGRHTHIFSALAMALQKGINGDRQKISV